MELSIGESHYFTKAQPSDEELAAMVDIGIRNIVNYDDPIIRNRILQLKLLVAGFQNVMQNHPLVQQAYGKLIQALTVKAVNQQ